MNNIIKSVLISFVVLISSCSGSDNEAQQPPLENNVEIQTPVSLDFDTYTYIAKIISEPTTIKVYEEPSESSKVINELEHPKEIPGVSEPIDLYFTFVENSEMPSGWINVNLPVRPNGSTGWIRSDKVKRQRTLYSIQIDRQNFELKVLYDSQPILTTPVAIGNGDTPTPAGKFFITELLDSSELNPAYGPYAYGLSGYSETLKEFKGVDAIIGIHGTDDPSSIGKNVSHGCIRVDNNIISEMTEYLPFGTPVEII